MASIDFEKKVAEQLAGRIRYRDPEFAPDLAYITGPEHAYLMRWIYDEIDGARKEARRWAKRDPQWPGFAREICSLLYEGEELDEVEEPVAWASHAHDVAQSLPEWLESVDLCEGDRWASGVVGVAIARAVLDHVEQEREQSGEGDLPVSGAPNGDESGEGGGQGPTGSQGENEAQERSDALLRQSIREAVRESADEVNAVNEALDSLGYGYSSAGTGSGTIPPDQRMALVAKLRKDRKLVKIAAEVGRLMRLVAQKRKHETRHCPEEIARVVTGDRIDDLLPDELLLAGDPDFEVDFLRRYHEQQLLTYERKGRETATRGPVVVALDVSGSMSGDVGDWAAAVAIALAHVAVKHGRPALVLAFDTAIRGEVEFERRNLAQATIDVASLAAGGGTDWQVALKRAREFCEGDARKWHGADVVLITDGLCSVSESFANDWESFKDDRGLTCYAMLVGYAATGGSLGYSRLDKLADHIHRIADKGDGSDVEIIFGVEKNSKGGHF